jgi:chromosome segregation ATPase
MRHRIVAGCFCTTALLVAALLAGNLPTRAESPTPDNPEVTRLLYEIEMEAADLQRDSEEWESFTRLQLSWESHADELNRIKERINKIGQTIQKLQSLRSSASPWQQEAIDRILPVARKLAENTTAAIEHLNKNPTHLQDPQYQSYLKSNAEAATQLAGMVKDFVEYGKTRTTLEALERRLEVPR